MKKEKKVKQKSELDLFLAKYDLRGFTKSFNKLVREYPNYWKKLIMENPYDIMELNRVGFKNADKIAMKLGVPKDDKRRIIAFVEDAIIKTSYGSTILPISSVSSTIIEDLEITDFKKVITALYSSESSKFMILNKDYKETKNKSLARFITKKEWYETEKYTYNLFRRASRLPALEVEDSIYEKVLLELPYELNDKQLEAVTSFSNYGVNVITGVAGGGKTTVVKTILRVLQEKGQSYTCLAPTGIASKVFMESTNVGCSTIHSKAYNTHSEDDYIKTDYLFLEEFSMYSCEHMRLISKTMKHNQNIKIIVIGDLNQLLPISAGCIFRDMMRIMRANKIKANIIYLDKIMRASDETFIPYICNSLINESYKDSWEHEKHEKVYFSKLDEDNFSNQVTSLLKDNKLNFENTLILIPQNKGDIGTSVINNRLQELNRRPFKYVFKSKKGKILKRYKEGDVLIHIKNNYPLNIFNGERLKFIGPSEEEEGHYLAVKIDGGDIISYSEEELFNETKLSYALSVHKTQGITVDNVIFVASKKHSYMLNRNLVYTGLSRASKELYILCEDSMLKKSMYKKEINKRKTFLGEITK